MFICNIWTFSVFWSILVFSLLPRILFRCMFNLTCSAELLTFMPQTSLFLSTIYYFILNLSFRWCISLISFYWFNFLRVFIIFIDCLISALIFVLFSCFLVTFFIDCSTTSDHLSWQFCICYIAITLLIFGCSTFPMYSLYPLVVIIFYSFVWMVSLPKPFLRRIKLWSQYTFLMSWFCSSSL